MRLCSSASLELAGLADIQPVLTRRDVRATKPALIAATVRDAPHCIAISAECLVMFNRFAMCAGLPQSHADAYSCSHCAATDPDR